MQIPYVEQLPIPSVSNERKREIEVHVATILVDNASPEVPRLEAEINRLVYELYGLTEAEIALVEKQSLKKQEEIDKM